MTGLRQNPPINSTPAASGMSPAAMAGADQADARRRETVLAPEITDTNQRAFLDRVQETVDRLNHHVKYSAAQNGLSKDQIAQLQAGVARIQKKINDPNTKTEEKLSLAQHLEDLGNSPLFGGTGSTWGTQFPKAMLRGLATQDPLLGLVLAIIAFLIRQALKQRKLNALNEKLQGLKPNDPNVKVTKDEIALTAQEDPAATAKKELDKELLQEVQTKHTGLGVKLGDVEQFTAGGFLDEVGAEKAAAIKEVLTSAASDSPLKQACAAYAAAGGADPMMQQNPPSAAASAATVVGVDPALAGQLSGVGGGQSPGGSPSTGGINPHPDVTL